MDTQKKSKAVDLSLLKLFCIFINFIKILTNNYLNFFIARDKNQKRMLFFMKILI
jgi:hypothetical protein